MAHSRVDNPGSEAFMLLESGRFDEHQFVRLLDSLIAMGIDINTLRDRNRQTLLQVAVINHQEVAVACMLNYGVDPNVGEPDASWRFAGRTPLHDAASNGMETMAGLLLAAGADPDIQQPDSAGVWAGRTPLFYAANYGHSSIIRLLMQYAANPYLTEEVQGLRPRQVISQPDSPLAQELDQYEALLQTPYYSIQRQQFFISAAWIIKLVQLCSGTQESFIPTLQSMAVLALVASDQAVDPTVTAVIGHRDRASESLVGSEMHGFFYRVKSFVTLADATRLEPLRSRQRCCEIL